MSATKYPKNKEIKHEIARRPSDPEKVAADYSLRDVKRQKRGVMACCPIHADDTASLKIDVEDGCLVLHCRGCGAGGDVLARTGWLAGAWAKAGRRLRRHTRSGTWSTTCRASARTTPRCWPASS